jgi:hypothetical protein
MAKTENLTHEQLYRFEDGYRTEDVVCSRLAKVQGIKLRTIDPVTGFQFGVELIEGHLKGRVDGMITGLVQAPQTEHVFEVKCCDEKKQAFLMKEKTKQGEKDALKSWDTTYYAQSQIYMHALKLSRHYLVCASAGARSMVSVRTEYNKEYAQGLIEKAQRIKESSNVPYGISNDPSWYQCKPCTFYSLCHEKRVAQVNCRTCLHSTPVHHGEWECAKFAQCIPSNFQDKGCVHHLFIPSLIPYAKAIDANSVENFVEYEHENKTVFRNGENYYSSTELSLAQDFNAIGHKDVDYLKKFDARIIA